MTVRLSKSKIMSSLQCLKRVHLEINRKDLIRYSKATEAAFALGHEVGDIAVQLYGGPDSDGNGGNFIEYNGGNFTRQLAQTEQLMNTLFRVPVFEATLQFDGVLVREDVLLPVKQRGKENGGDSWHIVEVKASTKVKPEHVQDCAVQGLGASRIRLSLESYFPSAH